MADSYERSIRETNVTENLPLRIGLSPSVGDSHLLLFATKEPTGEREYFLFSFVEHLKFFFISVDKFNGLEPICFN